MTRSLTGHGVRSTLRRIQQELPIELRDVPSGTKVLDWTVPDEWNLRRATLTGPDGRIIADTDVHPLHVVFYSDPVDLQVDRNELEKHLFSLPDLPDAIPYRTSFYNRTWGFCLTHRERERLGEGTYHAHVDATLAPGSLSYGELVIPGTTGREILMSTHVCHPHMANDNASGIAVLTEVGMRLVAQAKSVPRRVGVRLLFMPGSIGAITWLATNPDVVPRITNGLVLTGLGDRGPLHYKKSQRGDTQTDRVARLVLRERGEDPAKRIVEFSPYGYDERQFCSPGFDLAVGRLSRTLHNQYPEYHTSLDDLSFVDPAALADAADAIEQFVSVIESDRVCRNLVPYGEPQLGRRGLYTTVGNTVDARSVEMALLWILNQSDGRRSLVDIAERSAIRFAAIADAAAVLEAAGLVETV